MTPSAAEELFEALGMVLAADYGPKATAAFAHAREVWRRHDALPIEDAPTDFQHGAIHTDGSRSGGQPVGTNAASDAEVAKIPDALWPFIKHEPDCVLNGHWMEAADHECDCGLAKALATLQPQATSDAEALAQLVRFHETGGHEGDGSEANLARIKAVLATLQPSSGLREAIAFIRQRASEIMPDGDDLPLTTASAYLHGCANDLERTLLASTGREG